MDGMTTKTGGAQPPCPLLPTPMTTIKFTCHEICTYNYDMWLLPNHDYYKHDTYNSYDVID